MQVSSLEIYCLKVVSLRMIMYKFVLCPLVATGCQIQVRRRVEMDLIRPNTFGKPINSARWHLRLRGGVCSAIQRADESRVS